MEKKKKFQKSAPVNHLILVKFVWTVLLSFYLGGFEKKNAEAEFVF